ncbi:MAG: SHD1 domain-containing protein [Pirellulales bacterium]
MKRLGAILALLAIAIFVAADSAQACRGWRSRRCCRPCVQQCAPSYCQPTYCQPTYCQPSYGTSYAPACGPEGCSVPAASYPAAQYPAGDVQPAHTDWAPPPPAPYEGATDDVPAPPATPDDDLPTREDFPAPEEEEMTEEGDDAPADEDAPAEDDAPADDDDAPADDDDDAPAPAPAADPDEDADDVPPAEDEAPVPPEDDTSTAASAATDTALATSAVAEEPLWRMWTDATGKHQTKAVLVAVNLAAGKVSLRKENGVRIGVPLEKLSPTDREFVRALAPALADVSR